MPICKLGVVSDLHYACAAEQARGKDYEYRGLENPLLRIAVRLYRRYIWLRDPLGQGRLLDRFVAKAELFDVLVANGDYSCDTAFVGLSDDAAFQSADLCLTKLRSRFPKLKAVMGDHELGKFGLIGKHGGMRLRSLDRCNELGIERFWRLDLGRYTLLGVTSSLLALPIAEEELLPEERSEWHALRATHLAEIDRFCHEFPPERKLLLFCHDPTGLQYLWRETAFQKVIPSLERTFIGHLHSPAILRMSGWLAGIPELKWFGHTARRLSRSLREARFWQPFRLCLCPSLAGIELFKDGGWYSVNLDLDSPSPAAVTFNPLKR